MKKEKDYNDGELKAKEYMYCPDCFGRGSCYGFVCRTCHGEGSIHNPDWDGDE